MRISNWKNAKKQAVNKLPAFTITAAIICFVASFITLWNGSVDYKKQITQLNWPMTEATVSHVYEYFDAFHTQNGSGRTLYDIHYEYTVCGQIYTGIIKGQHVSNTVGEVFQIKYNQQTPEEHTRTLEPSTSYFVSGSVFGILGLVLVSLTIILLRKERIYSG